MRKMYNSLVSMFLKGWVKLFGEDPYTCELKEGDIVELLPQKDWCYFGKRVGGRFRIGFCETGDNSFGVRDVDGHVLWSCTFGEGSGFNRSHWKKVG